MSAPARRACALALAAVALLAAACNRPARERIVGLEVVGTRFEVRLSSGRVLAGADLRGATLVLDLGDGGAGRHVRIAEVGPDPHDPDGDVLVYRLLGVDSASGATSELCEPDVDGRRYAFPLQGRWDTEGHRVSTQGYTIACGGDALGKCVRFGYRPWATLPDGRSLEPWHQACVNLVRAAYCGTGTTRDGMRIDLWDEVGILSPAAPDEAPDLSFEAAWDETGAVCVAHTRVPAHVTLDDLAACPRLQGRLGPAACTPERARTADPRVRLYNRSG